MYAADKLCKRSPTYADILEMKQERWCTLNTLEISFKHVTNTLLYVGKRCHTSNRSQTFVLAYKNLQRMPTHCLYVRHKLDVRNG